MKTCNHTTEQFCCLPFNDYQLTISQIQQLNLSNSSRFNKALQFIENTRHLFNAQAVFTHVLHENYLMFRASSGMHAVQSLHFARHSASVLLRQSMQVLKLEQMTGWYTGVPVRNHEGRVVLVLGMIHPYEIMDMSNHENFIHATLAYFEYLLCNYRAHELSSLA